MTRQQRDGELPPDFVRFWWGEAVSGMGTAVTTLALQTLVVVTMAGGATEVGWLNTARWLPYLVLGLVVGALVDRVRRRPVMVVTDLVRAALLGLIPLAWAVDALSLPVLLAIVLLFGTASVVNDAASLSFVPRVLPVRGCSEPTRGSTRPTRWHRPPDRPWQERSFAPWGLCWPCSSTR